MRLGIFGGSFDPIHKGHIALAACCAEQAALDRVLLIPAAAQPLKPHGAIASAADRAAMVALAIAGDARFQLSRLELDRPGPSFTVDTLVAVAALQPDAELFLLVGADSLADFPRWREPARLCQLATPLVVARAGEPAPNFAVLAPYVGEQQLAEIASMQVRMPPMPIASRDIRRSVASGDPWRADVPAGVAKYIDEHGLYRP